MSTYEDHRDSTRMPILPLSDEVHFPHTELRLRIVEPEAVALVEELYLEAGGECRIGTVLLQPDGEPDARIEPSVFAAGTAARLIEVESGEQGCDIVLRGEFRFEVEREIGEGPCREAWVRPILEPKLSEVDPEIRTVRRELLACAASLAGELGARFALDPEQVQDLFGELRFEEIVNRLAAHLDIAPLRKLQLLRDRLPDRALHLLSILRSRQQVLDILRPFRHLADNARLN